MEIVKSVRNANYVSLHNQSSETKLLKLVPPVVKLSKMENDKKLLELNAVKK